MKIDLPEDNWYQILAALKDTDGQIERDVENAELLFKKLKEQNQE
jgi:ABC-type transporter Mla subunit MlaD